MDLIDMNSSPNSSRLFFLLAESFSREGKERMLMIGEEMNALMEQDDFDPNFECGGVSLLKALLQSDNPGIDAFIQKLLRKGANPWPNSDERWFELLDLFLNRAAQGQLSQNLIQQWFQHHNAPHSNKVRQMQRMMEKRQILLTKKAALEKEQKRMANRRQTAEQQRHDLLQVMGE